MRSVSANESSSLIKQTRCVFSMQWWLQLLRHLFLFLWSRREARPKVAVKIFMAIVNGSLHYSLRHISGDSSRADALLAFQGPRVKAKALTATSLPDTRAQSPNPIWGAENRRVAVQCLLSFPHNRISGWQTSSAALHLGAKLIALISLTFFGKKNKTKTTKRKNKKTKKRKPYFLFS